MADKSRRYELNAPGPFYVDRECISCDACILAAPDHFVMHEDGSHAYVCKQPQTDIEFENCRNAMEGCPVEAIGNDGADS